MAQAARDAPESGSASSAARPLQQLGPRGRPTRASATPARPPTHSSRARLYRARSQCPILVSPDPASSAAPISPYST